MFDEYFDIEESTELVNIAKETTGGTIAQRVAEWCSKSDRHVYIGRGSIWGNQFSHLKNSAAEWKVETREEAIEKYRVYILTRPDLLSSLGKIRYKILGCWCFPLLCHGMVLLELCGEREISGVYKYP